MQTRTNPQMYPTLLLHPSYTNLINEHTNERNMAHPKDPFKSMALDLPFFRTKTQGWSKRKSRNELHSGSTWGSRHKHVGLKNGNAWRVRNAAWHFVTVTVEQATGTQTSGCSCACFFFRSSVLMRAFA